MLKKLGIKSQLYHCNEGHAALLNLQRLVDYVQEDGLDFNVALEMVRASSLYTGHTPVPAGHDYFDEGLFGKYIGEFPAKLGISWQVAGAQSFLKHHRSLQSKSKTQGKHC